MFHVQNDVTDPRGNAIVGASIVVQNSDGTAATIYSDNGTTLISNSTVTTNADGEYDYYVAPGFYKELAYVAGVLWDTRTAVSVPMAADTLAAATGSSLVGFTQSGTGAVAETVDGALKRLPWVSITNFMSEADRATLLAGTQIDVTTALTAAAATGRPVRGPYGQYEISSAVTMTSNLYLEGGDTGQSTVILTGTGQLLTGDTDIRFTGGFKITTAVNSKTMMKVQGSRFYGDFMLAGTGGATGLTGIEWVTGSGLYHCAWVGSEVRDVAVPMRVTGSNAFNNNQLGADYTNWQNFTDAVRNESTLVFGANKIKGYVESGTNAFTATAGSGSVYGNSFEVWLDTVTQAVNSAVTIASNYWPYLPPSQFITTGAGAVQAQSFLEKIKARVTLNADQLAWANNTDIKVQWDTKTFDTESAFTLSPNYRFTAPRAMRALVAAQVDISGNLADGDPINIQIFKNGTLFSQAKSYAQGANGYRPQITDILDLAKSDYIEIYVKANGSGTHDIAGSANVDYCAVTEL